MIIWDENKQLANLDKHGLDFVNLDESFFLNALIRPARLGRFQAIGYLEKSIISVIFAKLGSEGISIISMRPAKKNERRMLQ